MGNRIIVQNKEVVYNEEVKFYSHRGKIVKIYNVWINGELTDMDDIKGTYIHERIMRDLDNRLNDKISTHRHDFKIIKSLLEIREYTDKVYEIKLIDNLIKEVLSDELFIKEYKKYLYNNLIDDNLHERAIKALNNYLEDSL